MSIVKTNKEVLYNTDIEKLSFSKNIINCDIKELMLDYILDCPVKNKSLVSKFNVDKSNKMKITKKINTMLNVHSMMKSRIVTLRKLVET